ncbi:MAG: hypothetical protein Q9205_007295 [Flavoplaca limonia]
MAEATEMGYGKYVKQGSTRPAKKANEYKPGRPDKLFTFLSTFLTEPICAAYLGYNNNGEFRKFLFSFHVLEFYNVWHKYCRGEKTITVALELIRDLRDREPEERFPADFATLTSKYGPSAALSNPQADRKFQEQERENRSHYMMATLIFRLTERLQSPLSVAPADHELRQTAAANDFAKDHDGLVIPPGLIAEHNLVAPVLGPQIDLGEHQLESYNRAYNLLRCVGYLSSKSRWKDTMAKTPFPNRTIHESWKPQWMLGAPRSLVTRTPVNKLPPKKIILIHDEGRKTKHTAALASHVEEFVEAEGLMMPQHEVLSSKDPRDFESGEQWRDTARRQLRMQHLRVDFFTIRLDKMMVYGPAESALTPWTDVLSALLQSDLEARFIYTLRPLEDGEEFEPEYSGPPIALEDDLRLGQDGDIEGVGAEEGRIEQEIDEAEQAENRAFLMGGGTMTRKAPVPQSEFGPEDRDKMLEQHEGIDVMTPDGLRKWQELVINKIAYANGPQPRLAREVPFKGDRNVSRAQRDALAHGQEVGEKSALSTDAATSTQEGRYYQVQAAFTGAQTQVGPYVDVAKVALGMKTVGKHKDHPELDLSECTTLSGCKARFLDSQITGAAFMIARSHGGVPVAKDRLNDPAVAAAAAALECIKTSGGFLSDVTGLGKTDETMLAVSYNALYGDHSAGHKPHLITVPNGAVFSQWQHKIWSDYRDLQLIISNDERPSEAKFQECWVSSTAMREAPASLKNWPESLRYIFDPKDPRASRVVILTPYDSHVARTVAIKWVDKSHPDRKNALALPYRSARSRKKLEKERKARQKELEFQEPVFTSKWKDVFESVWLDEGHRIRHAMTKTNASILLLNCKIAWSITATPNINSSFDTLGGLHIIWQPARDRLQQDQEAMKWLKNQPEKGLEIFGRLDELPHNDIRRLIALDPNRIRMLLETRDVVIIAKYYRYLDELVTIRRSTASILYRTEGGEKIELKNMMPKHQVKTVQLSYTDEEACEAQWFHRNNARYDPSPD